MAYASPTGEHGWRSVSYSAFGAPRSHPGRGAGHNGIDLTAPDGFRLRALDDCEVARVYWSNGGGGWIVELRLQDGRLGRYMHCAEDGLPLPGQSFLKGEECCTQGRTGNAIDDHLHLEIHENGRPIDPWPLLDAFQYTVDGVAELSTIRKWSLGPHTRYAQALLAYRYPLSVDGDYGPATEAAVKKFQAENGLVSDGIIGPNTWAALTVERVG